MLPRMTKESKNRAVAATGAAATVAALLWSSPTFRTEGGDFKGAVWKDIVPRYRLHRIFTSLGRENKKQPI